MKAIINAINEYHKCFQHATAVVLNHEETEKNSQRITKRLPFINRYCWDGINIDHERMIR